MDSQAQIAVDTELSLLKLNISDEQREEYLTLLKEIEHCTKYEVGHAQRSEDGFFVPVTVYPLDVYESFSSGIADAYQRAADAGELSDETIFSVMISYLRECLEHVQYKDAAEIMIRVIKDDDSVWQISEEDMYAVDNLLLPGI